MADINSITLTGRLARDPEIKTGGSYDRGWTNARFTLAVGGFKKQGEDKAEVDWIPCTAWNNIAKVAQNFCHKGSRVAVRGKLKTTTSEKDGVKRTYYDVRVEELTLLDSKGSNTAANDGMNGGANGGYANEQAQAEAYYQQSLNNASLRSEIDVDPFNDNSALDMDALGDMSGDLPF